MKLKTLPEKVRRPYKKCSAVSLETGLLLIRERAVSSIVEIVVVPGVKRGSGGRVPAEKKLAARVPAKRVVIGTKPQIDKSRELVGRAKRKDIRVESPAAVVISYQPALPVIEGHTERVDRLVLSAEI